MRWAIRKRAASTPGPIRPRIARGPRRIRTTCCARWTASTRSPTCRRAPRSWAEWLYFNGRSGDARLLPDVPGRSAAASGRRGRRRPAAARSGRAHDVVSPIRRKSTRRELLARRPDLTVGGTASVSTAASTTSRSICRRSPGAARASGALVLHATPGRSLPPIAIRGAAGWVSGYVVPVMSGDARGIIQHRPRSRRFRRAAPAITITTGDSGRTSPGSGVRSRRRPVVRLRPRPSAGRCRRRRAACPAFLLALGPDGPIGYATDVSIEEVNEAGTSSPRRITVDARSDSWQLTLNLDVVQTERDAMAPGAFFGRRWTSSRCARSTTSSGGSGTDRSNSRLPAAPRPSAGGSWRYFFAAPSVSWRRAPLSMASMA